MPAPRVNKIIPENAPRLSMCFNPIMSTPSAPTTPPPHSNNTNGCEKRKKSKLTPKQDKIYNLTHPILLGWRRGWL